MKRIKACLSMLISAVMVLSGFTVLGAVSAQAASYPRIPAFPISRVYQPKNDNILCYWASMATVQGYCLGTYTYGGITTNYRVGGVDYNYKDRKDAVTKLFEATAEGFAHDADNLKSYPVKMTLETKGIGKNAATYEKIYNQLSLGKPVIVYTGGHASVVIGYNGSASTLEPSGFTVLEVKNFGHWWKNSVSNYNKYANNPNKDTASGTDPTCYVTLDSWIDYCGGKVQEICYPTNPVNTDYTFTFAPDGGEGTMPSIKTAMGKTVTFPECTFVKDGYYCEGYYAQRRSDSKWHVAGVGWKTLQEIRDNNLNRSIYDEGLTFTMNDSWTKSGGIAGDSFYLVPVWRLTRTALNFYGNYSGTNYMMTPTPDVYSLYYQSRDASVYTVSCNADGELIIKGTASGSSGKDLLFKTQTNEGVCLAETTGDSKAMTLRFSAKGSVNGAKMYFRWGYTTDTQVVTLTTEWKEYTVDMSKQPCDGAHMHPYIDKAGMFYIRDISLCDSGAAVPTQNETSNLIFTQRYSVGSTYTKFPELSREGYRFLGWYTSKHGGKKITATTPVFEGNTAVYARWEKISDSLILGDSDLDGRVTVKDATLIQKYIAAITTLSAGAKRTANVIANDDINIKDATAIQKWCAGIAVAQPVGKPVG